MSTAAAPLTADDLLALPNGKSFELIDGELVELKMSQESSWVAGQVYFHLVLNGERKGLGWAFPEGTGFACFEDDPHRVRKPDASFILRSRQPEGPSKRGYGRVVPDLVVEVVSPHDLVLDVEARVNDWVAVGASILWVVIPATRSVRVYRGAGHVEQLSHTQELTLPGLIPEFRVTVNEIILPAKTER